MSSASMYFSYTVVEVLFVIQCLFFTHFQLSIIRCIDQPISNYLAEGSPVFVYVFCTFVYRGGFFGIKS